MIKISPSMLACDFSRMGEEASAMKAAKADMLHLDIMDGHFVPNISFGPPVVASLRRVCDMFFDVHLMVSSPVDYVRSFADAGAQMLTFHIESLSDTAETISRIRECGIKCGLVIKPGTPVSAIEPYLGDIDMILVMTVEPGFGGQSFMEDMLPKIRDIRKLAPLLDIEVDGGIDISTVPMAVKAGANVLVAGSSIFLAKDRVKAVKALREAAEAATA